MSLYDYDRPENEELRRRLAAGELRHANWGTPALKKGHDHYRASTFRPRVPLGASKEDTRLKLHRFTRTANIERDGEDVELTITYEALPYVPATLVDPPEGGEIEIVSIERDGQPFSTTHTEDEHLVCWLGETHDTAEFGPDPDDARDRMIDDRLMGFDR